MGHLNMSKKERIQLIVFEQLKNGEITQRVAASRLKVTDRWVRKKYKRYMEHGDVGLVHKSRNRVSQKRWCEGERALTVELLRTDWKGFGPTFTAEKLKELKNIDISKETVRKTMIKEGIWQPHISKKKHRKRRQRRAMLGHLVQLDGSPHDWFEGRGPKCTLLVFIDDATSKILWLEFAKSESHIDVMRATKNYINRHGRPHAFYVDFGGVFSVNLNNEERVKKTQWERAMEELEIEVKHAHSPQAKGRVERSNETLQDRLVKEMRLAGVCSIDSANQFLFESNFLAKHNERFSVSSLEKGDAHRPASLHDLDAIFCIREERTLANDYTIVHNKSIYQLHDQQRTIIRPKDKINVNIHLDDTITLSTRRIDLAFHKIEIRPSKSPEEKITQFKPYKRSENSRRWASGLAPIRAKSKGE